MDAMSIRLMLLPLAVQIYINRKEDFAVSEILLATSKYEQTGQHVAEIVEGLMGAMFTLVPNPVQGNADPTE